MTLRSLLFTSLFIVSISAFAQQKTEESKPVKNAHNVTAIMLETDDIEDLRKFDWNEMLEMLSENTNDDKEFKFTLSYSNPNKKKEDEFSYDNFKFSVSGKSKDAKKLLKNSQKVVTRFLKNYDEKHSAEH